MWYLNNPAFLFFILLPIALLFIFYLRPLRRKSTLVFNLLAAQEKRAQQGVKYRLKALFCTALLGLCALIIAMAGPIHTFSWTEKDSEGIDIVLVVDVSESMDADDFLPNRLTVAQNVLVDFIQKRPSDRIALVAFGGEAVTKSPLTRNQEFLLRQVHELQMGELLQGTAIGMGLMNGIARLKTSASRSKVIVLLTDGDSNVGAINPITATLLARQEGIKIYSIGIGKEDRVIVDVYHRDDRGRRVRFMNKVPSYLNPALLENISRLTGGKSYMARDSGMLHLILQEINQLEKTKTHLTPRQNQTEYYFWPAWFAFFTLLFFYIIRSIRYRRIQNALAI
jgi:Ca-activated chloride channel family protein